MSNSIFLCVKENNNNFNCYKFNSFIEANNHYKKKYDYNTSSTMISVCKYLPLFIQKFIIDYKLKNLFVKFKIITDKNKI
jgi:hypothetical protein